jgi:hypothetical protein
VPDFIFPQSETPDPAVTRNRESAAQIKAMRRDLKILIHFVRIYCKHKHPGQTKAAFEVKIADVPNLVGRSVHLCEACSKLLTHALVKRTRCPMEPKPACKHCPNHCYHPTYREQIREVMKFSGRKVVLSGRLDLLFHLLF